VRSKGQGDKIVMISTHKDLEVWKKSLDFVESVYRLTEQFPKTEMYGLTNQMRRAVVSISSNIAEGAARSTKKEFIQFLYIALGSLSEVETQLIIAQRLRYISNYDEDLILQIKRMLIGLIKSLKE